MSQPDQYPSSQPQQAPNGANAAPVDSSGPAAGTQGANQPSYGQYLRPAYGAMDNQFPQDYDPYIFGRPDPEPQPAQASQAGPTPAVPQPNQAPTVGRAAGAGAASTRRHPAGQQIPALCQRH